MTSRVRDLTLIGLGLLGLSAVLFGAPLLGEVDPLPELSRARVLIDDVDQPPSLEDARWQSLTLPDLLGRRTTTSAGAWYHVVVPTPVDRSVPVGLYVYRLHQNAAVWFNGVLVDDPGRDARWWNRPLHVSLPWPLWREQSNDLLLHIRTSPGFGMLAPPEVGPDAPLRARAARREFVQVDLSEASAATLTVTAGFVFALWFRRRRESQYLWFACSCVLWALFDTNLFLRRSLVAEEAFRVLVHSALDAWALTFAFFTHRFLGENRPRLERALAFTQLTLWLLHATLPVTLAFKTTAISHGLSVLTMGWLGLLAFSHWRRTHTREVLVLALAMSALVLAGVHDLAMQNPLPGSIAEAHLVRLWRDQFHVLFLAAPAVLLAIAWHLTGRFVRGLDEAERLNGELEARVAQAQARLAVAFEERRALELTQATTTERDRIYRDLHDDLGSRLLSLAIGASSPAQADTARAALQDLRDVVSRSGHGPQPLAFLLADWRDEAERRLTAANLTLEWDLRELSVDPEVPASVALHLGRIVREALSNVLKHAHATRVTVTVELRDDTFFLSVRDDGQGPGTLKPGRGLNGITTRAVALGARVTMSPAEPRGFVLSLEVPVRNLSVDPPSSRG